MAKLRRKVSKPLYKKKTKASHKDIKKEWKGYLKRTKGMSQMSYAKWLDFNYGKKAGYYGTTAESTNQSLRRAGLSGKELKSLGGK